jgi:hypothetical protein
VCARSSAGTGPFEIIEDHLATTLPDAWARRELAGAGDLPKPSDVAGPT